MNKLVIYRLLAWAIDLVIIVFYALLLFLAARLFIHFKQGEIDPLFGQLIGFATLTMPVFLYSYLTESGQRKSTLGKRIFKLTVGTHDTGRTTSVLKRNILKYLPWELAHTGVHWMVYYESIKESIPIWTWMLLIIPQIIVFIYLLSIIMSKGQESMYDRLSGTILKYSIA